MITALGSVNPSQAASAPAQPARSRPTAIVSWLLAGPGSVWHRATSSANASSSSHPRWATNARALVADVGDGAAERGQPEPERRREHLEDRPARAVPRPATRGRPLRSSAGGIGPGGASAPVSASAGRRRPGRRPRSRIAFAAASRRRRSPHRARPASGRGGDVRRVDLEVGAQRLAGVAPAEAVGAEHEVRLRDPAARPCPAAAGSSRSRRRSGRRPGRGPALTYGTRGALSGWRRFQRSACSASWRSCWNDVAE